MLCLVFVFIGVVLVAFHPALSLFDSGASHCFLSRRFAETHSIPTSPLLACWNINTGSGVIRSSTGCSELPVILCGRQLFADFLVIDLPNFEAVFGMNWLGTFFASIDCRRRRVVFRFPGHPEFEFASGDRSTGTVEYIAWPREVVLALHQGKPPLPEVAREFDEVFADVTGLPPDRVLEFEITLMPGAQPISRTLIRWLLLS